MEGISNYCNTNLATINMPLVYILTFFWIDVHASRKRKKKKQPKLEDVVMSSKYDAELQDKLCTNKLVTPLVHHDDVIKVKVWLELIRVFEMNEQDQYIDLRMILGMSWNDPSKRWNKTAYGGRSRINCPPQTMWMPDLMMNDNMDNEDKTSAIFNSLPQSIACENNGNCLWFSAVTLQSACKIDVMYFPYDDQLCNVTFNSWLYDSSHMQLQIAETSNTHGDEDGAVNLTKRYIPNGEWNMRYVKLTHNNFYFMCCPKPWSQITLTIAMERQSSSHTLNLVVPCTLIAGVSLIVFALPEESGEKISFATTILFALTVFQQYSAETMPSFRFPLLAVYYFIAMVFNVMVLLVTTFTLYNYFSRKGVSKLVDFLVLEMLAKLLFMKVNRPSFDNKESRDTNDIEMKKLSQTHTNGVTVENGESKIYKMHYLVPFDNESDSLSEELNDPEKKSEEELIEEYKLEWIEVNKVLNRFFFIFYIIGISITFIALFSKTEMFQKLFGTADH